MITFALTLACCFSINFSARERFEVDNPWRVYANLLEYIAAVICRLISGA